jgi:ubiquinone/menaquinone biosynthesis C-methylase UbiE
LRTRAEGLSECIGDQGLIGNEGIRAVRQDRGHLAMRLDATKAGRLDAMFEEYAGELRRAGDEAAAVMLAYTHGLHRLWRPVLEMLPVRPSSSVLDVGSGLGILVFELAANVPVDIEGVDIDRGFVEHARTLLDRLVRLGYFAEGKRIGFSVGDICDLAFADDSFDFVFVREVFQFVPDPSQAVAELFRVLRPGGLLCLSDMDDQLRITWPPASPEMERLVAAVAETQHERGGDRQVGRKLTSYLRAGGFEINSLLVLPEAQHRVVDASDHERALIVEQLRAARARVLETGAMNADRFDADLAAFEREIPFEEFRMSARIIVLGQRPMSSRP